MWILLLRSARLRSGARAPFSAQNAKGRAQPESGPSSLLCSTPNPNFTSIKEQSCAPYRLRKMWHFNSKVILKFRGRNWRVLKRQTGDEPDWFLFLLMIIFFCSQK